jgi:RNA-directed DNA polymerase
MNLLEKVSDYSNLMKAYKECSCGKRASIGYKKSLFAYGEKLGTIRKQLLNDTYRWSGYRRFLIADPKTREIMAAPFMDRVVHHAIHRAIEPILDQLIPENSFACRKNKGSRNAALYLLEILRKLEKERFTLKLDVKKYFDSINHTILMKKILENLPDKSLEKLLWSLLKSPREYARLKV